MPHIKFTAAAIAILAFAAASPALAQRGSGGDDLLVGGRTSYQAAAKPAQAGGGGGTVSDDVIVDGRIITGENPASAAGGFDQGFTGGVFVASGSDSAKGPAAGGSRHTGGANFQFGDGSVRFNQPSGGGANVALGDGSVRGLSSGINTGTFNAPKGGSLGSLNGLGSIGQLAAPPGVPPTQAANNLKQLGLASHNYDASKGDVNGDGVKDVITGAGAGGSPHVKSGPGGGPTVKVYTAPSDPAPARGAAHVKVFSGNTNAAAGAGNAAALKGQAIRSK